MYMNRFIIGALVGIIVGMMGAWCMLSSEKDKQKVMKCMKYYMP